MAHEKKSKEITLKNALLLSSQMKQQTQRRSVERQLEKLEALKTNKS